MGATAGIILTVGSTLSTVLSQQEQARAAVAQGNFEGAQFDRNAQLAGLQASDAVLRGDAAAKRLAQIARGEVGSTRAGFAGQGVVVDQGSAADVVTNRRGQDIDALNRTVAASYTVKCRCAPAGPDGTV